MKNKEKLNKNNNKFKDLKSKISRQKKVMKLKSKKNKVKQLKK